MMSTVRSLGNTLFHLIGHARETIQAQFEQIRQPAHSRCPLQIGARRDHTDNPRTPLGRATRHHSFFVTDGATILLNVLGQDVELEIYEIAGFGAIEIGVALGAGNNPDRQAFREEFRDREADSVDCDRTLGKLRNARISSSTSNRKSAAF